MMVFQGIGAGFFGAVIGWITYFILRRAQPKTMVDLGAIIGVLAGGAILKAFDPSGPGFAGYGIGLGVGFFGFYVTYRATIGENSFRDSLIAGQKEKPLQIMSKIPTGMFTKKIEDFAGDNKQEELVPECTVLSISDWITFLSSEKHGVMGTLLGFSAVLVALVAILLAVPGRTFWEPLIDGLIAAVFIAFSYVRIVLPYGKKAKYAQDVLNRILNGDLRNEKDIRNAWLKTHE